MGNECQPNVPSVVEIRVTESDCPMMPPGDLLVLEGPSINYAKSGPVCITALNAIYPWVMVTRFAVKSPALDFDLENDCYHCVCPCGIVHFDIRKIG
jgi:uncharacterized repeat protein (TIGR04076 family)